CRLLAQRDAVPSQRAAAAGIERSEQKGRIRAEIQFRQARKRSLRGGLLGEKDRQLAPAAARRRSRRGRLRRVEIHDEDAEPALVREDPGAAGNRILRPEAKRRPRGSDPRREGLRPVLALVPIEAELGPARADPPAGGAHQRSAVWRYLSVEGATPNE